VTDLWRHRLRIYVPIAAIVVTAFVFTYRSLDPTPPSRVRIAAGGAEGMYMEAARRYRDILARDRVDLDIVATVGSLENIALLRQSEGGVDLQLEADVSRLKIPATHAEHLYHLRTHVDFMKRRLLGGSADARASEPRVEPPASRGQRLKRARTVQRAPA
jgi:hypothetical protein